MKRIGLILKPNATGVQEVLERLVQWLVQNGKEVILDEEARPVTGVQTRVPKSRLPSAVDLIIVLGGDGTLLSVARLSAGKNVPILGVNLGGLGFLTEVSVDETIPLLRNIFEEKYVVDRRIMLRTEIVRDGEQVGGFMALNDVVVSKGPLVRMIALEIRTNGNLITSIRGDGLIISTPTGSTAYSLSAGGPILHPSVEALLITPISPHMLTNRPVVIPLTAGIEVVLKTRERGPLVIFDGQEGIPLHPGDRLNITRGDHTVPLLRSPEKHYYEILRKKLKWGEG